MAPEMDMREMMEHMQGGTPQKKPLIPRLLDAERLSEGERNTLRGDAERRVQEGLQLLASSFHEFTEAQQSGNVGALARAVAKLQEGASLWETGSAVLHTLSSPGARPESAALRWFREQMNLESTLVLPATLPWGLSWVHLGAMVALGLFAAGAMVAYLYKMQWSLRLLNRLTRGRGKE
jgi:hypothetical protein